MRLLRKILLIVLVVLLVLVLLVSSIVYLFVRRSFPQTNGTLPIAGLQDRVEVYRD
ncbi:MAG: hypothetical protein H5T63_04915, partial [Chloroflexi bacterium]|nr:hypothetical protein [Chloroflexota bacterium]